MSTIDNASAKLAITLQLQDLDELEALGAIDKVVIRLQRQQLEIDSGSDAVAFEASRRLAVSMAKAVEEDSALLARSTPLPTIDEAGFERLVGLNHPPLTLTASHTDELATQQESMKRTLRSTTERRKRGRSSTPDEPADHFHKRARHEQITISSVPNPRNEDENTGMSSVQVSKASTAEVSSPQVMKETTASATAVETSPATAECASCSDSLTIDELVKASCNHHYCKDCFGSFVEASLHTHDGFPPTCCKIPIAFGTVAHNVSATLFGRYSARQAEIKNATALHCGIQGCSVRIEEDRINGVRATCVACWRDTCTICRGEFPRRVGGKNFGHVCRKDKAREEVLELAKKEGWQICYQCGNMVALNFGCHHMRCRCKAEFCYRCGTKWKNCDCGNYDEPRLETRAVRGVDLRAARRIRRGLPPDLRPREEQLAELQQRLQVDCDHNDFLYEEHTESDPGYYRVCEYPGWKYILRCVNCRFTACRDCHNFFGWNGGEDPWEELRFGSRYYDNDTDDERLTEDESTEDRQSSNE